MRPPSYFEEAKVQPPLLPPVPQQVVTQGAQLSAAAELEPATR